LHQHLFSPREGFAVKLPENNIVLNIIFKCINVKYKNKINSRLDLHQHLPGTIRGSTWALSYLSMTTTKLASFTLLVRQCNSLALIQPR
jgi:hypothetical protein